MKSVSKQKNFHWNSWSLKCRLQIGGNFVPCWICYRPPIRGHKQQYAPYNVEQYYKLTRPGKSHDESNYQVWSKSDDFFFVMRTSRNQMCDRFMKRWTDWWMEGHGQAIKMAEQNPRDFPLYASNSISGVTAFNSSPLGQNGHHFADDIFICNFVNEKFCILTEISPKWVPKGLIDNISALV